MKILFAVFLALAAAGCSHTVGNFSIISTAPVDFTKKYERGENKAFGEDVMRMYFILPPSHDLDLSLAVKDALTRNCADFLTDVTITQRAWLIPVIYGDFRIEVEGTPWFLEGVDRQRCLGK